MIFVDTGAFIARYIANDQFHEVALEKWQYIEKNKIGCVTSNFVLDETFTLLGRRCDYQYAVEKANVIYASNVFQIMRPEYSDELMALSYFKRFADQKVSFTDCITFALMKKSKIKKAFSFDKHFPLAKFDLY